jgi:hypothetical protein
MGLFDWFRRKGYRKLTIQVSPELYSLYEAEAARNGQEIDRWARALLNRAIPRDEVRRLEEGALRAAGIEAAYQALDEVEAEVHSIPMSTGHPCGNLRGLVPVGYKRGECQGTCGSTDRQYAGKVCHWPASRAQDCPAYETRTVSPRAIFR